MDEVSFYHVGMLKTANPTRPTVSNRTTACRIYIYYLIKNIYYYPTGTYILKSLGLLDGWTVGRPVLKIAFQNSCLFVLFFFKFRGSGGLVVDKVRIDSTVSRKMSIL